jgi:3-oxoacid CoA-transferase A subunit
MSKMYLTADEAVADIRDGCSIALYSWGLAGTPYHLIAAIKRLGIKDITLYCPNFGILPVESRNQLPGPGCLINHLRKVITPGIAGPRQFGPETVDILGDRIASGKLEAEIIPHGIWIERLHAAAMGLGGFYNPVGVGTMVEAGKEKRLIDDREYFLEKAFQPDVGLIKADKADKLGNLVYRRISRGANPIIAMASRLTIVEVDEIVEVGKLDSEAIVTPMIYVDRIVKIPEGEIGSAKSMKELVRRLVRNEQ